MTRIIHVASGREWRGGQRQTWLLARELQALGVEQRLITRGGSELARRAQVDGISVREVSWSMGLDPRAYWAVRAEAHRGPAILHAHDGHAVTVARWAATAETPWIVTRRNASPLRAPAAWRRAARVVAISAAVRDQLRRDGIAEDRLAIVPSGIDLEATRATPHEDLRAWARLANGGKVVITIAALTAEKGLETIPEALALLARDQDVRWVIVGDGPLRDRLLQAAAVRGVGDRLSLPGHHPDPVRLLRGADLFVLPSRIEGLGTSVLDALALGVPVVATRAGGLVELLDGGAGLLVPVADAGALADAVARMLADSELRRRSIEAGRATAERYTARGMAMAMRAVYASVDATR